jgi:hypothetical protein
LASIGRERASTRCIVPRVEEDERALVVAVVSAEQRASEQDPLQRASLGTLLDARRRSFSWPDGLVVIRDRDFLSMDTSFTQLSIFVGPAVDLEVLHGHLADLIGHQLQPKDGVAWLVLVTTVLRVELTLYEHDLVDDVGIRFTDFRYTIDLGAYRDGLAASGYHQMYARMAEYLAAALAERTGCQTIVVANLQRVTAVFGA